MKVSLEVRPAGATVYYVSDYTFRATARLGLGAIRDVDKNWNQFGRIGNQRTQPKKVPMSGKVRFYAIWPNGREEIRLVDLGLPESPDSASVVSIRAL